MAGFVGAVSATNRASCGAGAVRVLIFRGLSAVPAGLRGQDEPAAAAARKEAVPPASGGRLAQTYAMPVIICHRHGSSTNG